MSLDGGGLGHRPSADADESQGVLFAQDAGGRRCGELADRVPGDAGDGVAVVERVPRQEAGRDDERLSDLRVADPIGIPLGAGGDEVDARPLGVGGEALARAVELEPGGEEPGGLGALPGEDRDDHFSILPRIERRLLAIPHRE